MRRLIRRGTRLGFQLVLGALALTGCRALDMVDAVTPRGGYSIERDQAYGPDPRQRLDVYRPAADTGRPIVLFFYGGNWKEGSKNDYRFVGQSLATAGYVTVVADYRLYPAVSFPGFVEDGAAATAWTAAHLTRPDGTPRPIVLLGHSAGAYIAALLATDKRYLDGPAGPGRRVVEAWVGLAGPYQFQPKDENARILASPDGRPNMAADAADAGTPPAFLLVAGDDEIVGKVNADRLEARLQALGVPVVRKTYPGLHHATLVGGLGSSFGFIGPIRGDVLAYLDALPSH
ncbi:MAG TPA: alpha/beta hydrolase [Aliidongia sp.]|uniref:alpha/beta hydrolase n=1 Tax=Aliidongia sp. TaxID=1914230 RepID=UPI002DDD2F63|nr:alpha/beta hydrolase [Aliidongia sp.]HEV2674975.1 alpha/beta hydrolase [Aliidongia sp.]